MKISGRYLGLSLALVLLLGLAYAFRPLLHAYLVEPLSLILWLAWRTLMVVDQKVYWALLVLAAIAVGLSLVAAGHGTPRRAYHPKAVRPDDRSAFWHDLLVSASHDPDARLALQRELENLIELGSPGLPPELETDRSGRRGEILLPPVRLGAVPRLKAALGTFLPRLTRARPAQLDPVLIKNIEPILQSIEKKLEMNHEPSCGSPSDD